MDTNQQLHQRELGNTGLKVSCIGFGASPLGKVFGHVSEEEAAATVIEAFKRGINYFDTSPGKAAYIGPNLTPCWQELPLRRHWGNVDDDTLDFYL